MVSTPTKSKTILRFRQLCNVRNGFVVPATDQWAKMSWGLKLGAAVWNRRRRSGFTEQHQRDEKCLQAIAFNVPLAVMVKAPKHQLTVQEKEASRRDCCCYETLHEATKSTWSVSCPLFCRHFVRKLVTTSYHASSIRYLRRNRPLVVWLPQAKISTLELMVKCTCGDIKRLRHFNDIYGLEGHSYVPRPFIVSRGDERWPVTTWGIPSGERVHSIRQHRSDLNSTQLEQLHAIGFALSTCMKHRGPRRSYRRWKRSTVYTVVVVLGHCSSFRLKNGGPASYGALILEVQ